MVNENFFSTAEVAKILGISRIAVFKKIQKGHIPAQKVGRSYVIPGSYIQGSANESVTDAERKSIEKGVKRVVREYGETLRLLGKE